MEAVAHAVEATLWASDDWIRQGSCRIHSQFHRHRTCTTKEILVTALTPCRGQFALEPSVTEGPHYYCRQEALNLVVKLARESLKKARYSLQPAVKTVFQTVTTNGHNCFIVFCDGAR